MNIKEGLRRILTVILSVITAYYLFIFILSGFIFWKTDYIAQAEVFNKNNPTIKESLIDFSRDNFEKKREFYLETVIIERGNFGFEIHPYKRYFKNWDGIIFKDKHIIASNNVDYIVKLPSVFNYLVTQIWQFLLIPLCWLIIWTIYLIIESTIIWIINGFKNN